MEQPMEGRSIKIVVTFELREDGGLRAWSDDLPGFVLSHSDPQLVIQDVKPALEGLITDLLGERVSVEPLVDIQEALLQKAPPSLPTGPREYVSRSIAA